MDKYITHLKKTNRNSYSEDERKKSPAKRQREKAAEKIHLTHMNNMWFRFYFRDQ